MTPQDDTQLEIETLVRLDGVGLSSDILQDLLERRKTQEIVEAAMSLCQEHSLLAIKMEPDDEGGFYLAVRGLPDEEDEWFSAHDDPDSDLKDDLDSWDAASGRSAQDLDPSCKNRIGNQEMLLADRNRWLDVAYGEDLAIPVRAQLEAKHRSDRALAPDPQVESPVVRSRNRP